MNYKEVTWQVELDLCPHCLQKINLSSISYINQKVALSYFFDEYKKHQKNCFPGKRKKTTAKFTKTEWLEANTVEEKSYDYQKIIL